MAAITCGDTRLVAKLLHSESLLIMTNTMVLRHPAGLSKELCLYTSADWLKLNCESEGGERGQLFNAAF